MAEKSIHFRVDDELYALLQDAAQKTDSSPSAIARSLIRSGLQGTGADVKLETMRLTQHTIKRATSRLLKEALARLPELFNEGLEIHE